MQAELTKEFATDLDAETTNEKGEELTPEKGEELGAKISEFTMRVMRNMAQADPATGRTVIRVGGGVGGTSDFELALQKEKDLFYLAEGFTVEQVTRVTRESRQKQGAAQMAEQLAAHFESAKKIEDEKAAKKGGAEGDDEADWEDVSEQGKEKVAKTVEIE